MNCERCGQPKEKHSTTNPRGLLCPTDYRFGKFPEAPGAPQTAPQVVTIPCSHCNGSGRVAVNVEAPRPQPGTADGDMRHG